MGSWIPPMTKHARAIALVISTLTIGFAVACENKNEQKMEEGDENKERGDDENK